MQIPSKVNKVFFVTSLMASQWPFEKKKNQKVKITPYLSMHGLQYPWSRRAMDKGKIEAMHSSLVDYLA